MQIIINIKMKIDVHTVIKDISLAPKLIANIIEAKLPRKVELSYAICAKLSYIHLL